MQNRTKEDQFEIVQGLCTTLSSIWTAKKLAEDLPRDLDLTAFNLIGEAWALLSKASQRLYDLREAEFERLKRFPGV